MTKLLEEAVKAAQGLPPEAQDDIARLILQLTNEPAPVTLSAEESAAIVASRTAAAKGEFASDEQVRKVWDKRGL